MIEFASPSNSDVGVYSTWQRTLLFLSVILLIQIATYIYNSDALDFVTRHLIGLRQKIAETV